MIARRCTLLEGVRVERGGREDWLALAPLHYRGHHPGAVTDIFRLVHASRSRRPGARPGARQDAPARSRTPLDPADGTLVGVIVYARAPLALAARNRATGGRYRLARCGRVSAATLINRELRIISRLVIAPNWRGLGLGSRLVRETLPRVGTPYVETLAAMGRVHPFFERAGMTAYPYRPPAECERLRAALEAAGIGEEAVRVAADLAEALDGLPPAMRRQVEAEVRRWVRSYLGAKNRRTNRPDRARTLDLVARNLRAEPVYYLWRRPTPAPARSKPRG